MPKALVITVGTSTGVEHGISFSIRSQNPDFILFLCSPKSRETLNREPLATLLQQRPPDSHYRDVFGEAEDVEKLAQHYHEVIRNTLLTGPKFSPSDITVDHTPGTKSMSVALGYVALELGVGSFAYVTGKRDPNGRVQSGTERFLSFVPNELYFRKHRRHILGLFNGFQFHAALDYIHGITPSISHPERKQELQFLKALCEAYQARDALNIPEACRQFESLSKNFPQWIDQYDLKKKIEDANRLLHLEQKSDFAKERALDLLANSDRRFEEGRYDQAVAILYRLLEFIAQVLLNHKGIKTSEVDPQKIPREHRSKWENRKAPDGKLRVSLVQAFELLADLDEEIGKKFIAEYQRPESELKKVLEARNHSLFAHGFQPVERHMAEKMRALVVSDYLPHIIGNIEDELKPFRFPRLSEPTARSSP